MYPNKTKLIAKNSRHDTDSHKNINNIAWMGHISLSEYSGLILVIAVCEQKPPRLRK